MIWRKLSLFLLLGVASLGGSPARPQSDYQCPDGQDHRCSDGKFHAPDGSVQPEACDNMPKGSTEAMHNCDCERSSASCDTRGDVSHPGAKCQTYCRPKACKCASPCDS
jgi:hypothetical protein